MQINIEKRHLVIFGLIIAGLIVIVSGIFVYAAWDTNKKVYHSADDVKVNVGGVDYSLQEAINQGKIGGSAGAIYVNYSNNCVSYPGNANTGGCQQQSGSVGQWLTIPNMVIEQNFPAGKLTISSYINLYHLDCCSPCYNGNLRLLVDGNSVYNFTTGGCEEAWYNNVNFRYIKEVSAGNHRIEVQWKTDENVGNAAFYTGGQRSLEVLVVQ